MPDWRADAIREVSDELWRYLSLAAHPEAIAASAEGLLQLPKGDVRRLVAAHLLLSDSTPAMLECVSSLLGRMPASVTMVREETVGLVHGPVDWAQTRQLRLSSGDRTRFVCLPPDRHYDTALGRLLLHALTSCSALLDAAGDLRGSPGSSAVDSAAAPTVATALAKLGPTVRSLRSHVKFAAVRPERPDQRVLDSLARRSGIGPVIAWVDRYVSAFEQLDPATARSAVEERLLAPAPDDQLFELLVGFRLVRQIEALGFHRSPPGLIEPGHAAPFARFDGRAGHINIWWQRSALPFVGLTGGLYADALRGGGLDTAALLPDFVIELVSQRRCVLVEVKHTTKETAPVARGVKDALLYLMDARDHFDTQPFPHAVVVALGARLGSTDGRIIITGPNTADLSAIATSITGSQTSTMAGAAVQ